MTWVVEFYPLLPMPIFWGVAAIAALISIIFLLQRRRGALIRCLALSLLIMALANPNLRQEERESLSNIALVVVDESASQKIAGRSERTKALREALAAKLAKIPNLEIRWVTSSHRADDDKEGTTLFADLNRGLSGIPTNRLSGVILITDGQIHDAPGEASSLDFQVPVHAFITGRKDESDRRIEILKAPRFGIVGSSGKIKLRVLEQNTPPTDSGLVRLKVTREGQPAEFLNVEIGTPVEIPMMFPHAGPNIVELELVPGKNELTLANNRTAIAAEGVRENLRVLLVSGEPHAGERTWRNLLKSDAAVDLVHFTILRPPEKQDGTPINQLSLIAFPTRELFSEKLNEFDLIIFDRYQRRGVLPLLYLDNVARYVSEGGAVLVAAGHSYSSPMSLYRTPLSHILPAAPTGRVVEIPYKAQITASGNKHPVTRKLPGGGNVPSWGRWFRLIDASPQKGEILMKGPEDKPLLILDRIGEGRVALLLSDHAWLWARGYEGGGPYTALLRRLAHWLMKEPDLEEEFLRASGKGKSLLIERRSMKDKITSVELTTPSGEKTSIELEQAEPGLWRKKLDVDELGLYRVKSEALSAIAHVGPLNSRELATVTATDEILKPVLETAGGGIFWSGSGTSSILAKLPRITLLRSARVMHGSNWVALRDRNAYEVKGIRLIPLFTGFLALSALLGFVALTWFREGR